MPIIIKQQDEIEVFINDYGQISILAKAYCEEDRIISVSKENSKLLCIAIKNAAKEIDIEDSKSD